MRLLSLDRFDVVFADLRGKRIGVVDGEGNVGDRLLYAATRQLLIAFGLKWQTVAPLADPPGSYESDVLLLFAGGSMGGYRPCRLIRQRALDSGIPCIVLPQSFIAPENRPYQKVFVRERASLQYHPQGILAPDLALGYEFKSDRRPTKEKGVFLRESGHSAFPALAKVDPAVLCYAPGEYVHFAADYKHIVTDRLHLAITALGLGRRVTLLPVAYHKNRSMWETWLKELGCEWADEPPGTPD